MSEKRFTIDDDRIKDNQSPCCYIEYYNGLVPTVDLLNELHEEVMELRRENTKFKLTVREIIGDMQEYVDNNQLVYINQSYVDWIKKEVDTTLYPQKRS